MKPSKFYNQSNICLNASLIKWSTIYLLCNGFSVQKFQRIQVIGNSRKIPKMICRHLRTAINNKFCAGIRWTKFRTGVRSTQKVVVGLLAIHRPPRLRNRIFENYKSQNVNYRSHNYRFFLSAKFWFACSRLIGQQHAVGESCLLLEKCAFMLVQKSGTRCRDLNWDG